MINNRQNGRRRGRGGPQVRGGGNGMDRGNRIDNRARGNAAQLHEKYRNLARDMQTQGDRVMTEYYLQFADHYFRVLSETRQRFEEQNPQHRRPRDEPDYDDGDGFADEGYEGERVSRADQQQAFRGEAFDAEPQPRGDAPGRDFQPRAQSQPASPQHRRDAEVPAVAAPAAAVPPAAGEDGGERRPRRPRRRPSEPTTAEGDTPAQIEIDRLPPALSAEPAATDAAAPSAEDLTGEPAPRRRRRVKGNDNPVAA